MMRIFIDTNILLDLILKREPNYTSIAQVCELTFRKGDILVISSLSIVNAHYIVKKLAQVSESVIRATLGNICNTCEIVALTPTVTMKSLVSAFPDFEDATQYFCALENDCNVILTYNKKDFVHSTIPVLTATEFLTGYK
ncbi:MAG: PIN domain-containing protein [Prevotellaceae bacterium]|jgi:predicted nucleic acid-binding protein|nr:PIN domain-containing protein [Prevotellaceae bacterium]